MQNSRGDKLCFALVLIALLSAGPCVKAAPSASAPLAAVGADDQKPAEFSMPGLLSAALDSKKLRAGDGVEVVTVALVRLSTGAVISKGAKVTGHVVQSKAISKGDGKSLLAIAFDKIVLPDGKMLKITGRIQAVAPNPEAGQLAGGGVNYGNTLGLATEVRGESAAAVPVLNEQSAGVEGIGHLGLGNDGELTSGEKSVKLEHNSQLVLRAQIVGGQ